MSSDNGQSEPPADLELQDTLVVKTAEGKELEFEVVGIVEDEDNERKAYAVCYCQTEDEFVVTESDGSLLDDLDLAQEILDDFRVLSEEAADEIEPAEGKG